MKYRTNLQDAWLIPDEPEAAVDAVLEINSIDVYVCLAPSGKEGTYGGIEIRVPFGAAKRGLPGHYIVRTVEGKLTFCNPHVFEELFEPEVFEPVDVGETTTHQDLRQASRLRLKRLLPTASVDEVVRVLALVDTDGRL